MSAGYDIYDDDDKLNDDFGVDIDDDDMWDNSPTPVIAFKRIWVDHDRFKRGEPAICIEVTEGDVGETVWATHVLVTGAIEFTTEPNVETQPGIYGETSDMITATVGGRTRTWM